MSQIIKQIDEIIEEKSLLKHPFYQMWSDGKLSLESLAGYSKEYFQLVKEVPNFMNPIIEKSPKEYSGELVSNQKEESEHIALWINFAKSLGVSQNELENYPGFEKTREAVSALANLMNSFEEGSCAMYAFEKEIPKISQTKLDGLAKFYGISTAEATEYFKLHLEADIRHSAAWRNIIEKSSHNSEKLIEITEKSVSAQNLLLDSCYENYC